MDNLSLTKVNLLKDINEPLIIKSEQGRSFSHKSDLRDPTNLAEFSDYDQVFYINNILLNTI